MQVGRVVRKGSPGSIYVGRPTPVGNPFVIGRDGNRDEVIAKYRVWFAKKVENPEFAAQVERVCAGKDLACFCAPLPCHADVIIEWLKER